MNETCSSYCTLMVALFAHRVKKDLSAPDERQLVERIRGLWSTMCREERLEVNAVFEPVVSEYEVNMGVAWIRCPACRKPFTADVDSPPEGMSLSMRCPACNCILELKPHVPK